TRSVNAKHEIRNSKEAPSRACLLFEFRASNFEFEFSMIPKVILKPKRAQPFFARHPWVYAGAIDRVEGDPADGDEVELVSGADTFVARGLFNSQSKITVRLYSWDKDVA